MATGPEHYREAEQYLGAAEKFYGRDDFENGNLAARIAQVHATLAHAAAVAELGAAEGPGGGSATGRTAEAERAWTEVLDDQPEAAQSAETAVA